MVSPGGNSATFGGAPSTRSMSKRTSMLRMLYPTIINQNSRFASWFALVSETVVCKPATSFCCSDKNTRSQSDRCTQPSNVIPHLHLLRIRDSQETLYERIHSENDVFPSSTREFLQSASLCQLHQQIYPLLLTMAIKSPMVTIYGHMEYVPSNSEVLGSSGTPTAHYFPAMIS